MIRKPETVISENRTYVVFIYAKWVDEKGAGRIEPRVVTVPEDQPNTGSAALWHYINQVDRVSVVENLVMTQAEFDCAKTPA